MDENKTIFYLSYSFASWYKVVQHIMLSYTFTGKGQDSILIKEKNLTIKRKIICVGDYVAFYRKLVITLSSPPVHEMLKHQPICPSAGDQRPLFWWRGTTAEPYLSTILGWLREREMIDIYSNICWQGIVPECTQTNMLVEDKFLHQFIEDFPFLFRYQG